MFVAIPAALALLAAPEGGAPQWSVETVKMLFMRAEMASRVESVEQQDALLAQAAGVAYQVEGRPGESTEAYARRILQARDPTHGKVRTGQWLTALTARFYADLGERASWLARLAKDLRENKLLLTKSEQALAAAAQLGPMVEIELPGLDGFVAPLPFFDGEEPGKEGCRAVIRMQSSPSCQGCESIEVDTLDRVTCRDHLPPADAERTSTGALREIYSAMKLFNTRTEMMAMGFSDARKGLGQIRAFIPGQSRAGYLNEIIRAGREAGMHTVFVMGTAPSGKDLRQITVALSEPKKKGKSKGKTKLVEVRCKDDETMSKCARRMAEARGGGAALIYRLDDG